MKYDESLILKRLKEYHHAKDDSFFAGVKSGSTYLSGRGNLHIIDALAFKPTWTNNLTVTGYEVKCSKGDFRGDDKWHYYIQDKMVNKLYFATPPGMIKTGELPAGIGLVEIHESGLKWVRRALVLNTEIKPDIWKFLVFSRLEDSKECPYHGRERRIEHYAQYVKNRKDGKQISYDIPKYIENRVKEAEKAEHGLKLTEEERTKYNFYTRIIKEYLILNGHRYLSAQIEDKRESETTMKNIESFMLDAARIKQTESQINAEIENKRYKINALRRDFYSMEQGVKDLAEYFKRMDSMDMDKKEEAVDDTYVDGEMKTQIYY